MLVSGVEKINNGAIGKHALHMAVGPNCELSKAGNSVVERGGGRGGEGETCLRGTVDMRDLVL